MGTFLETALRSADVEAACRVAGVGMGDYLRGRRTDPAFELACQELDLIVRAAAVSCMEAAAARGETNVGKLKLLLAGVDQLRTFAGDGPEAPGPSLPIDAPPWLPDLLSRICTDSDEFNQVVLFAVESSYRAAVEWSQANPGRLHYDFAFPGPCSDCREGLAITCPNPRCAAPLIVRNCSDAEKPSGERWKDYRVIDGEPVGFVESAAAKVDFKESGGDD